MNIYNVEVANLVIGSRVEMEDRERVKHRKQL